MYTYVYYIRGHLRKQVFCDHTPKEKDMFLLAVSLSWREKEIEKKT